VFAGIELGGTKTVCAVALVQPILSRAPSFRPPNLRPLCAKSQPFFVSTSSIAPGRRVRSVDLRASSKTYGHILKTPKEAWREFDLAGSLRAALDTEIRIDTDVGCAALGEMTWGVARGLQTFLYVTVGTGIGGGAYVNGSRSTGCFTRRWATSAFRATPPMSFRLLPVARRLPGGSCRRHSMEKRWGAPPRTLPPEHPAWALETRYLATAVVNWLLTLSPECIILGGGIMEGISLDALRARVLELLNDYCEMPLLVRPALGRDSGVLGAIALAAQRTL
jgi:fructokinase